MITPAEYYNLPYSSQPEGYLVLTEEDATKVTLDELESIMNNEDYTKRSRFIAALEILGR
ncbi:hypothetical protein VPHF101_0160 [Vibrio phage F101]